MASLRAASFGDRHTSSNICRDVCGIQYAECLWIDTGTIQQ